MEETVNEVPEDDLEFLAKQVQLVDRVRRANKVGKGQRVYLGSQENRALLEEVEIREIVDPKVLRDR